MLRDRIVLLARAGNEIPIVEINSWELASLNFASWNLIGALLKKIDVLRKTARMAIGDGGRIPSR